MRIDQVLELPAGEELDLLVYDRIMGRLPKGPPDRDRGDDQVRRYSTDIRHAERVLLRIVTDGRWSYVPSGSADASTTITFRNSQGEQRKASASTRALAICRAALLTVLAKE